MKTAFALARFRPNGTNDRAFGHGGRVVTRSASAQARAVALQPDGKLVVVGEIGPHGGRGFALARYLT